MNRFEVMTKRCDVHGLVYFLRDLHTKATATVLTAMGANCIQLSLSPDGESPAVAVINDFANAVKTKEQPFRYGIPILFPWPSNIPNGVFQFEDKVYRLRESDESLTTQHGYAQNTVWRVLRSDCDDTGAWVTCALSSDECPEAYTKTYPGKFELEFTWKLTAKGFLMEMQARNTGSAAMPMGLGLHPYFSVPLGPKGRRDDVRLHVDATRQWDLSAILKVKPGEKSSAELFLPEPTFDVSAEGGTPLADTAFNHVLEADFRKNETAATMDDAANGLRLKVTGDRAFGTWVLYSPSDRPVISLEPWTMVPNAFNLASAGVDNGGMITLKPGDTWRGTMGISLERL